jgi:hypothetical protein
VESEERDVVVGMREIDCVSVRSITTLPEMDFWRDRRHMKASHFTDSSL